MSGGVLAHDRSQLHFVVKGEIRIVLLGSDRQRTFQVVGAPGGSQGRLQIFGKIAHDDHLGHLGGQEMEHFVLVFEIGDREIVLRIRVLQRLAFHQRPVALGKEHLEIVERHFTVAGHGIIGSAGSGHDIGQSKGHAFRRLVAVRAVLPLIAGRERHRRHKGQSQIVFDFHNTNGINECEY